MAEEKTKKGIDARVKLKVDVYHKQGLSAKEISEADQKDRYCFLEGESGYRGF